MRHNRETGLQAELKQTRPFRSDAAEGTVSILRTADVVRRRLTAAIEPHGITFQQYNVLRILRGAHPEPMATLEIAERLIEQMPGITRLLDRLEENGLVRRERCEDDRRMVHCRITGFGLQLLAAMEDDVDRADAEAIGALSAAELQALIELLARVRRPVQAR